MRVRSFGEFLTVRVLVGALCLICSPTLTAEESGDAAAVRRQDLERHVSFLASDTLEGREAGSRGGLAARQYLIGELKKFGLQPAGDDGRYLQDFVPNYCNVLGLLPAQGPDASDDVVLIGAHYDHVGYGRSTNSQGPLGYIHNGADDNASGTAAVLEIAEALAASEAPRRCAVLIAFWDAEEINLNGSEHWCSHPTIPLSRIKLAINVDMVGRLSAQGAEVHGARSAPGLRTRLTRANEVSDVQMRFKDDHPRNSDHYSFLQRRIPYLMVDTLEHADYHRPSDDIERLNFDGLTRMAQLLCNLTRTSAEGSTPEFRRDCLHESHRQRSLATVQQRFGVSWSDREASDPLVITEVAPDSAAARAGLQVADTILEFGGVAPGTTAQFRQSVADAVGPVQLLIQREGHEQPLAIEVRLDGHPKNWGIAAGIDPVEPGVLAVTSVAPGSPAAAASIRPGDRILDQRRITTQPTGGAGGDAVEECQALIERDGRLSWRTLPSR